MTSISSVLGNSQKLDGGSMFGNAPRPVWSKWIVPDDIGRIPLNCRALLIETDQHKILCETGIGAFFEPKMADRFGVQNPEEHILRNNLKQLNIEPEDIDYVILSHLHFDHAGGLLPTFEEIQSGDDGLIFPNAKFVVGQEAWDRAMNPHFRDRASFIPGLTDKLKTTNRLLLVHGNHLDEEFESNIEFIYSHGHTPGQMHTLFKGAEHSVFFAGDLIPGKPWVHLPITMGYDRFPEMLIDEKQKLYERAVSENWIVFYTHDPHSACSFVQKDEKGRFRAAEERGEIQRWAI